MVPAASPYILKLGIRPAPVRRTTGRGFLLIMTPKISLCIIAGNVERYITRFLKSFRPLADEIVVVRAIGGQEPDRTLEIAKSLGCRVTEYHNASEHADWPHVDDFAAARNHAFSLASCPWVAWADTDDTIDPDSIAAVRAALVGLPADVVALSFDYNVPEDGLSVVKERIIRKGAARWIYPVHEQLEFPEDDSKTICRVPGAHIEHAPDLSIGRKLNDERNARLLESIPPEVRTVGHSFHLFQSLRALGRLSEAVKIATQVLTERDAELNPPEKYELIIALAQMCEDPSRRAELLLRSIGVCPDRREAYGDLALTEIALGRPAAMLAWSRAMLALPSPTGYLWNHRSKYYKWCGVNIHAMALRANGAHDAADAHELNHFKAHGARISLLHATRGRPQLAAKARQMWLNRAADPDSVEHIFAFDGDDDLSGNLCLYHHVVNTTPERGDSVTAWNCAAAKSSGHILVQLNDDFIPPMHWDRMLVDAFEGHMDAPAVLRVSDGHRTDDLLCIAVMNRARYHQQRYFLHPRFKSVFSDNYHSWSAWQDDIVIDARHIVIQHDHPYFKGGEGWDEVYAKHNSNERYLEGEAIYNELTGAADTRVSEHIKAHA